jgi:hypothetical protein
MDTDNFDINKLDINYLENAGKGNEFNSWRCFGSMRKGVAPTCY